MKIGIDARLLNESGVGRYIKNLVYWLAKIDRENEYVLFLRKKEFLKLQVTSCKLQVRKVLADIRWHTLKEQVLLPKILEKEKLDLVHFPYFSVPIFYNRPFVVTIHDLTITHFPTGKASTLPYPAYFLKRLGYQFVLARAIKKAKKIIVPSKSTKKEILDHFAVPEEKIAVTYEGVDRKCKMQNAKCKTTIKNSKFIKSKQYFLYVGNAYPHKNLERLLRAFQKLKTRFSSRARKLAPQGGASNSKLPPASLREALRAGKTTAQNLKLILVGKEDFFYKRLKKVVKRMGFKNEVVFYGDATDEELSWLYQNAIALVLPSLMEGFGLPALEAMACGCLVLVSDISALKEVCGKAAIYFNPLNLNDIAKKMREVFAHPNAVQYKSKVEAGLKRAKTFSWQKMARETLKVCESCIGS